MALTAIFLCLSLILPALSTPLQALSLPPTLSLTTPSTTLTTRSHCFIQPHHPGAPTLHTAYPPDCRTALTQLLNGKPITTPLTFGRGRTADVRLPLAQAFGTCKIILDVMDEMETVRVTWGGIGEVLGGPGGLLRRCLGQGGLPALGGRTSVGETGAMQAIVVGVAERGVGVV